jgi:Mat/Ecp fimbriae outer membrane usher protein
MRIGSSDSSITHHKNIVTQHQMFKYLAKDATTRRAKKTIKASKRKSLVAVSASGQESSTYTPAENRVPPGFRYLLEKQSTLVDVVFDGKVIGSFMADYQPGHIQFRNPRAIVNKIPKLAQHGRAKIVRQLVRSLSGNLNANSAKSCYPVKKPGCDTLDVAVAGVIFNPDSFRAILFINPSYIEVSQRGTSDKYFKAPQTGLTNLNNLGMAISGGNNADTSYAFNARMLFGKGATHLITNALVTSGTALSTNELLLERDMPGYYYGGGLFRSSSPPLVNAPLLYGGEFATSYRTQVNRQQNLGNKLMVYLSRPAQVEIWRDGRILSVSSYGTGNQVLDTSTLPLGNYTVTLKIREAGGITREETRLFIKSDSTPETGLPLINVEAGKMSQEETGLPKANGDFWMHGSLFDRMNENLALGGDFLLVGGTAAVSAKAQMFFDHSIVNAAATVTGRSNAGVSLGYQKDFWSIMNVNFNLVRTWIKDRNDRVPLYNVGFGNTTQVAGHFSVAFPNRSRLSLNATYNKSDAVAKSYSYGVSYKIPVARFSRSQLYMTASATKTNFDSVALLQFELIGNTSDSNWSLSTGYEDHTEYKSGLAMDGSYGVTNSDILSSTGSLVVGAQQLSNSDKRLYTSGILTNAYGRLTAGAQVTQSATASGNDTNYYANYNTGLVVTGKGVAAGGENMSDSAVLVHLDGVPDSAHFNIFIDGQLRAKDVSVGSSVPVFLTPYLKHAVYIRGVDAPSAEYDTTARDIVLFAGNVKDMVWDIRSVHVVFGRLLDHSGQPLRNVILKGLINPVQTDAQGYFQGEVTGQTTIRGILPGGRVCHASIGLSQLTGELVKLGGVICQAKGGLLVPIKQPVKTTPGPVLSYMDTTH